MTNKFYKIITFVTLLLLYSEVAFSSIELKATNHKEKFNKLSLSEIKVLLADKINNILEKEDIIIDIDYFFKKINSPEFKDIEKIEIESMTIKKDSNKFAALINLKKPLSEKTIELTGKYYNSVKIPTISSKLKIGDKIKKEDIAFIRYPLKNVKKNIVYDEKNLIGKNVKKTIKTMQPINKSSIELPKIIERNDIVNIIYKKNHIKIRTLGIALENGKQGNLIRIKNKNSNKIVKAIILNKNTALVN